MLLYRFRGACFQKNWFHFGQAKSKKEKTFYQTLQVPQNATPTTIKKNYIKLAKLYHPDVYKGADKNRFQRIQEAYKVLSNQSDRQEYDSKMGVKNKWNQSDEDIEDATSQSTNAYGKPKNEFKYAKPKSEIDIDQEYEKFFNKKSTTHFEEIRLHEQPEFKAMSENERTRRRFTEVYPDLNLAHKMQFSKSYSEVLDDQINQKNRYEQDLENKKKDFQRTYTEQGIERRKKYIMSAGFAMFLCMVPFIMSFKTKLQLQRKAKEQYEKRMGDMLQDMNQTEIRERMKFR